jgi:type 1 glutamine amidotransferase
MLFSAPAAAADGPALKVCLLSGCPTYNSEASLTDFQQHLESNYNVACTRAFRKAADDLPGLENLETCDVALVFIKRMQLKGEQLERIKKYCAAGKPIVAVRTASHAVQTWLEFDKQVLGGSYDGHYEVGPVAEVKVVDGAKDHPLLMGVGKLSGAGPLYKNQHLAADAEVLLTGTIPGHTEPVAWTRTNNGGRVFYTSLGNPEEFKNDDYRRLLVNALFWTAKRPGAERKAKP